MAARMAGGEAKLAPRREGLESLGGLAIAASGIFEMQALEVGGDLDVHGRAGGVYRRAAPVEAVGQGPGDEYRWRWWRRSGAQRREAHAPGRPAGVGVAENSPSHGEGDPAMGRAKGGGGGEIIDALGGDAVRS